MGEVVRVLKPNGTFWLAIGDEYAAELKVLLQRELRLTCRSWVVWYYTFGVNCKNKFSRSHAHLFHMVKDPTDFTFNADDDPRALGPAAGLRRRAGESQGPAARRHLDPPPAGSAGGLSAAEDTWYFPRVGGTFKERAGLHGCQMPEQLLGRIIRACSNEGELVLDPFAGSGTTLAVAKKLGRRYLGFELSAEYTRLIKERLRGIRPGDPLDGAPEPLVSAPTTAAGRKLDSRVHGQHPRRSRAPVGRTEITSRTGITLRCQE